MGGLVGSGAPQNDKLTIFHLYSVGEEFTLLPYILSGIREYTIYMYCVPFIYSVLAQLIGICTVNQCCRSGSGLFGSPGSESGKNRIRGSGSEKMDRIRNNAVNCTQTHPRHLEFIVFADFCQVFWYVYLKVYPQD